MHRPETWGYVQFSKRPVGSDDQLQGDPTAKARYLLHKVLYRQEQYQLENGCYATTLEQLGLDNMTDRSLAGPLRIEVHDGSYRATAQVRNDRGEIRTLQLRGDGKIRL